MHHLSAANAAIAAFILICNVAITSAAIVAAATFDSIGPLIAAMDADLGDGGDESMLYLYFKVMDEIDAHHLDELMHPGRGHARFGLVCESNPLPLMSVCELYLLVPERFQALTGLSPPEFYILLGLVKEQMLKPRNGFCEFTDEDQLKRKPKVRFFC